MNQCFLKLFGGGRGEFGGLGGIRELAQLAHTA